MLHAHWEGINGLSKRRQLYMYNQWILITTIAFVQNDVAIQMNLL